MRIIPIRDDRGVYAPYHQKIKDWAREEKRTISEQLAEIISIYEALVADGTITRLDASKRD